MIFDRWRGTEIASEDREASEGLLECCSAVENFAPCGGDDGRNKSCLEPELSDDWRLSMAELVDGIPVG